MAYQRKIFHKDEHCLNCGYPIIGNFCGECGQKAHLHKDSFWHMVFHFVGDYFHYDNKFLKTFKTIITQPGQITVDYIQGKRVKFLNPIQLYILVTTIFFIVLASTKPKNSNSELITIKSNDTTQQDQKIVDSLKKNINQTFTEDTTNYEVGGSLPKTKIGLGTWTAKEATLEEYDSVQQTLPKHLQDNFFINRLKHQSYLAAKDKKFNKTLRSAFFSNIPKAFFLLLPFFAFLLKLFFRKNKLYYVDHIIFSIHFHAVGFLFMLFALFLSYIFKSYISADGGIFIALLILGIYLFFTLKNVYGSSILKTLLKQFLMFLFYFAGFVIVLILLFGYTFFTMNFSN